MGSSGEPGRCEHGKLYAEFCWDCVDRSAALGSSGSGEALSEARLAEIRETAQQAGWMYAESANEAYGLYRPIEELLAEVERLRAREAALVAVAQRVAASANGNMVMCMCGMAELSPSAIPFVWPMNQPINHMPDCVFAQARALLASTEQEA